MCGNFTVEENVKRLMGEEKADMLLTDPPYNIDYKEMKKDRKIKNDIMEDDSFLDFLSLGLKGEFSCSYVFCSWQKMELFKQAMEKMDKKIKSMIIWDKEIPAQNLDKYFKQHELIFYSGPFGGERTIRGDIWKIKRQRNEMHPTMKPVELLEMMLNDNSEAKIVYDGFLGSGSTLIACEKTNRKLYGCEIDPHYIDVIVKRYSEFTKQTENIFLERDGKKTPYSQLIDENPLK